MSAEQTEQRRWAVTVSYTTEETYYVDAEDEDEAEDKALNECDSYDAEVLEVKQIAGSKPVPPLPPVPLTGVLTLLGGRVLTLPCADKRGWFRLTGDAGDWWSNGHVAVRASAVEGYTKVLDTPVNVERVLPKSAEVGQPAITGRKFSGVGKEYIDAINDAGDLFVRVDAVYWPLVCDPSSGVEPRIVAPEQPVYGVRGGEIVAVVMPVRQ